jgi:hypothetical protein
MKTTTQPIGVSIERDFVGHETARDFVSISYTKHASLPLFPVVGELCRGGC